MTNDTKKVTMKSSGYAGFAIKKNIMTIKLSHVIMITKFIVFKSESCFCSV